MPPHTYGPSTAPAHRADGTARALTVFRKELFDGLRERRAVVSAFLFGPLLGPVLFAVLINFAVTRQMDEALEPMAIPVVGGDAAPNLLAHLRTRSIDVDAATVADRDALRSAVRRSEVEVGLVIAEDFASALADGAPARVWVVADGSNTATRAATSRVRAALQEYGRWVGANRLLLRAVDPALAQPLAVLTDDVSTPSGRAIMLLGMMTYFLLFSTLIGGVQVAIDTTAGERERGTMEALLTLPAPRWSLVLGKFGATVVFMVGSLAIAIVSFAVAASFLPLAEIGMDANLDAKACVAIFGAMLPFAVLGAGLMMIVASYTRNFREAQTYTSIAMTVPPLPILVFVFNPVQASLPWMLAPSLSQHLLATAIIKAEGIDPVHALVSAASTLLIGTVAVAATIRRYRSEKLLL